MRTYKLVVNGFDSGLNELLGARLYDFRTKKYRNNVKANNDKICCNAIRFSKELKGRKIDKPIVIHYKFYCKNKRRDRLNVASCFEKSFADALQLCNVIKNDGWDDILGVTYDFAIDKNNPRILVEIEEVKQEPSMWEFKEE